MSEKNSKYFRVRRGDLLIFLVILSSLIISYVFFRHSGKAGAYFSVRVDNTQTYHLSLDSTGVYKVNGPLGVTVLEVRNGEVHITDSPCSQKLCVHMGAISKSGEAIVCLPNKVVITIEGGHAGGLDAVTR